MMGSTKMVVAVKSIIFTLGFLLGASASNSSDLDCEAKIPVVDGKWQCPDGTVVPFRPLSVYHILDERKNQVDHEKGNSLCCFSSSLAKTFPFSVGYGKLWLNPSQELRFSHFRDISTDLECVDNMYNIDHVETPQNSYSLKSLMLKNTAMFDALGWHANNIDASRMIIVTMNYPIRKALGLSTEQFDILNKILFARQVHVLFLTVGMTNDTVWHKHFLGARPQENPQQLGDEYYEDFLFGIHYMQCPQSKSGDLLEGDSEILFNNGDISIESIDKKKVISKNQSKGTEPNSQSTESYQSRLRKYLPQLVAAVLTNVALICCAAINFSRKYTDATFMEGNDIVSPGEENPSATSTESAMESSTNDDCQNQSDCVEEPRS